MQRGNLATPHHPLHPLLSGTPPGPVMVERSQRAPKREAGQKPDRSDVCSLSDATDSSPSRVPRAAPAIIFIDELDAVGAKRGADGDSGSAYKRMTGGRPTSPCNPSDPGGVTQPRKLLLALP